MVASPSPEASPLGASVVLGHHRATMAGVELTGVPFFIQPVVWRGAGVDRDHVRAVAVAEDHIGYELSLVNGGVPTVTYGNTMPLTRAPPISGSG